MPVEGTLVSFVQALRDAGLIVGVDSTTLYTSAVAEVGLTDRDDLYWAGRASLVRRHEDVPVYDEVFESFWTRSRPPRALEVAVPVVQHLALDDGDEDESVEGDDEAREERDTIVLRASRDEILRSKDFSACTADELDEVHRLMTELRLAGARRRTRRRARRSTIRRTPGSRLDMRTTMRRTLRSGGEIVELRHRRRRVLQRRVVLLLDMSGSMDPYARALLRFAHAAVRARAGSNIEVFALGTRLTRLTAALATHDLDGALANAAARADDWSGGTRLGDGLRAFNDGWGVRGMARGAVVVVLSDGWERGDPETLGTQMARLHRVAHRVVWVNPLKASDGYEPSARGMAAALPHVDEFLEGHSFGALAELAEVVGRP